MGAVGMQRIGWVFVSSWTANGRSGPEPCHEPGQGCPTAPWGPSVQR